MWHKFSAYLGEIYLVEFLKNRPIRSHWKSIMLRKHGSSSKFPLRNAGVKANKLILSRRRPGLPDFSWCMRPKLEKCTKWTQNAPNGHQISIKYSKGPYKIYQHFPISGPENFSQIGIFGLKANHLATLPPSDLVLFEILTTEGNRPWFYKRLQNV
jgi:hypothetical protein